MHQIGVDQLRTQCARQFRYGVWMLVISRYHRELIAVLYLTDDVFDEVEDAPGRFGISSAVHALAQGKQKPLVSRRKFDLKPGARRGVPYSDHTPVAISSPVPASAAAGIAFPFWCTSRNSTEFTASARYERLAVKWPIAFDCQFVAYQLTNTMATIYADLAMPDLKFDLEDDLSTSDLRKVDQWESRLSEAGKLRVQRNGRVLGGL